MYYRLGRYEEAEKLVRIALEIYRTLNIGDDSQYSAQTLSRLGAILTFERKMSEAASVYAELDKAIAKWEPQRRAVLELNGSRINAMFASGQTQAGLEAAQLLLKREIARVGEKHFDAASARGTLAVGLMRAGKNSDAIREFKLALPVLLAAAADSAEEGILERSFIYATDIAPLLKMNVPVIWVNRHNEKLEGRKAPSATVKNFRDAAKKLGAG